MSKKEVRDEIGFTIIVVLFFAFGFILAKSIKDKSTEVEQYTTPVKESKIDTLYIDKLICIDKIKYIDSIKYDTIEKVIMLDDTASIELFYKLVSE